MCIPIGSEVEEIIDYAAMLAVTSAEGFGINNAHMLAAYKLQALSNVLVHLIEDAVHLSPTDECYRHEAGPTAQGLS